MRAQNLGSCSDPATQNTTLCELVGEFEELHSSAGSDNSTGPDGAPQTDQLQLIGNPVSDIEPWQNFLLQAAMTQVLRSKRNHHLIRMSGIVPGE